MKKLFSLIIVFVLIGAMHAYSLAPVGFSIELRDSGGNYVPNQSGLTMTFKLHQGENNPIHTIVVSGVSTNGSSVAIILLGEEDPVWSTTVISSDLYVEAIFDGVTLGNTRLDRLISAEGAQGTFVLEDDIILPLNNMLIGNSGDKGGSLPPGSEGEYLRIVQGSPTWSGGRVNAGNGLTGTEEEDGNITVDVNIGQGLRFQDDDLEVVLNGSSLEFSGAEDGLQINTGNSNTWTASQVFQASPDVQAAILNTQGDNVTITDNFVPTANNSYDLGAIDTRWNGAYFSGNSIHIGDATTDEMKFGYESIEGTGTGKVFVDETEIVNITSSGVNVLGNLFENGTSIVSTSDNPASGDISGSFSGGFFYEAASIVNADINGSANIDVTKLAAGTDNQVLLNNGTNVWGSLSTNASLLGNGIGTAFGINLANSNAWTARQTFSTNASGTANSTLEAANAGGTSDTYALNVTDGHERKSTDASTQSISDGGTITIAGKTVVRLTSTDEGNISISLPAPPTNSDGQIIYVVNESTLMMTVDGGDVERDIMPGYMMPFVSVNAVWFPVSPTQLFQPG